MRRNNSGSALHPVSAEAGSRIGIHSFCRAYVVEHIEATLAKHTFPDRHGQRGRFHTCILQVTAFHAISKEGEAVGDKFPVSEIAAGRIEQIYGIHVESEAGTIDSARKLQIRLRRIGQHIRHRLQGIFRVRRMDGVQYIPHCFYNLLKGFTCVVFRIPAVPERTGRAADVHAAVGMD